MPDIEHAIMAKDLHRTYNGRVAVDGISFVVKAGEVFGFLGPNGAGKTTTIRMLTAQLRPTSGTAQVAGCDIVTQRPDLKTRIGVVFEDQNIYERMTARENLMFYAQLYRVKPVRVQEVLEQMRLADRANEPVGRFSNGMKQRLIIARALLHHPRVLFLDEPTRGLDPVMGREIRGLIADLARQGMTIFLTTHYMEEADQLCQRVAIVDQGQIIALDAPARLKRQIAPQDDQVVVTTSDGQSDTLHLQQAPDQQKLVAWIQQGQLVDIHSPTVTLEDVFIQLTGRSLNS
ncbi:Fluoroquinolones export ATP-binding protein [Thermoflexales bacterium]|nr:Fluoroquinolones export ATP-binding protein [Thermoflexales bacterium]